MNLVIDPLSWALLSMLGMVGGNVIAAGTHIGKTKLFGVSAISLVHFPRIILVLPIIQQIRFDLPYSSVVVTVLALLTIYCWLPLVRVSWATKPDTEEALATNGVYGLVRHPRYLGSILFHLALSVHFGSVIGVMLTPLWVVAFYLHSIIEELSLEQEYGDLYKKYKSKVKSRIIPWVPV